MFFVFLLICYIISYFLFAYFLQIFFKGKFLKTNFSVFDVAIFSFVFIFFIYISNFLIEWEFGNRIQHAFGWGFTIVMILFFSLKASQIKITKIQFFFLSFFIASTFWVFNEMIEFLGQNYLNMLFAPNINDIWLDLYANEFGILIWSFVFCLFLEEKKEEL